MQFDPRLAGVARRQKALFTAAQALEHGATRDQLDRLVAAGHLDRPHPSVFRLAGSPRTWEQRCVAAILAAGHGSVLSHRSAVHLWRIGEPTELIEISVPGARHPRLRGVTVHRSRDLEDRWVTSRRGVPATNPLMTMVDLGAVVGAPAVEDALDLGLVARLFTVAALEWTYNDLARPGRRGCGVLRRVLDERALGDDRPDGLLEPRMARLLRDHGLPPAVFQHPVGRYRIDFAYPEVLLAIEVDGYGTRASPRAMRYDLERQNHLVLRGWTVLRFTWHDVVRRPGRVAGELGRALRGRGLGRAAG